jgi:flagellar motor switch protein FliN
MSNPQLGQSFTEAALRLFREAWSQHLIVALTSLSGEAVELGDDDTAVPPSPNQWFHQAFPPLEGTLSIGVEWESAIRVGTGLLKATLIEKQDPDPAIQAFAEMLGHASAGMASQFSALLKSEVRMQALIQSDQPLQSARKAFQLQLVTSGGTCPIFVAVVGSDLVKAFDPEPVALPVHSTPAGAVADPLAVSTRNLDLLLDVELPISVSFGRAQLLLKDVIKLTTGSIVELNRSVSEPVDIIVNNCTIARGEVVVVEGNFGVRIKQIVSKQERLRSVS